MRFQRTRALAPEKNTYLDIIVHQSDSKKKTRRRDTRTPMGRRKEGDLVACNASASTSTGLLFLIQYSLWPPFLPYSLLLISKEKKFASKKVCIVGSHMPRWKGVSNPANAVCTSQVYHITITERNEIKKETKKHNLVSVPYVIPLTFTGLRYLVGP